MDLQHADYFEDFNNKLIRQNDDYINIYYFIQIIILYLVILIIENIKKYFYLLRYDYNTLC